MIAKLNKKLHIFHAGWRIETRHARRQGMPSETRHALSLYEKIPI
jgi:hypothetical protein